MDVDLLTAAQAAEIDIVDCVLTHVKATRGQSLDGNSPTCGCYVWMHCIKKTCFRRLVEERIISRGNLLHFVVTQIKDFSNTRIVILVLDICHSDEG